MFSRPVTDTRKLLPVLTYPEHLPRSYHPHVESVDHVENVALPETQLVLVGLLVIKMCSEIDTDRKSQRTQKQLNIETRICLSVKEVKIF